MNVKLATCVSNWFSAKSVKSALSLICDLTLLCNFVLYRKLIFLSAFSNQQSCTELNRCLVESEVPVINSHLTFFDSYLFWNSLCRIWIMASSPPLILRLVASSVMIANQAGKIIRDVMAKGELSIVYKVRKCVKYFLEFLNRELDHWRS